MHSEPIRHHYIPQFILKNFCFEEQHLHYFDKQTRCISVRDTRDIFMVRNLYRDEINSSLDPVKIEKDLAEYEREVAQIMKERFLSEREIFLSVEEEAKLRLFFAIMGFRSINANLLLGNQITDQTKAFYSHYQADGNVLDMWKRNLGYIVQCRSFEEVWNHPHIDAPIKLFFRRDTEGYWGKYIAVAETNEGSTFVIGDAYPTTITGILPNNVPVNVYDIFPISSKRVLFLVNNGAQSAPRDVLGLRQFLLQPPKRMEQTNMIRIRVRKLCADEVQYINREVATTAQHGFAFQQLSSPLPQIDK